MTPEQFEQAKREFAEKWGYLTFDYVETNCSNECLSDLTALLEQQKEVIKDELRKKLFSMRSNFKAMSDLNDEDKLMQYGYHDCINEMLMWLKNVKK